MSNNVSIVNGYAVYKDKLTGIRTVKRRNCHLEVAHEATKKDAFKAARIQGKR